MAELAREGAHAALRLAVVGHTNVGKTSLLRTLARDAGFGEVSPRHGTTRHVEGVQLAVDGEPVLDFYDTPGLEDAVALRDLLDAQVASGERLDGPARVQRFLDSAPAHERFEQEAKVLRQLLASDAALVVIDAREPVLAKYVDELEILRWCGRPLLPVFNFVADARSADTEPAWREVLARAGLHALVRFDSVTPPLDGEQRLYEALGLLLDRARPALQRLADDLRERRRQRRTAAARLVAELLVDVAACRRRVEPQEPALSQALERLRTDVRQREQACVDALMRLYAFRPEDALRAELPMLDGRWERDLFHPQALRDFGVRVGGGMAAGAAAGVGVDLMVGGLTLGAAAAIGALAGGAWQTLREHGRRIVGSLRGERELSVDDAIVRLLALRQRQLLEALEARGHAATSAMVVPDGGAGQGWREGTLPDALQRARTRPDWSALGGETGEGWPASDREAQVEALARQWLDGASGG